MSETCLELERLEQDSVWVTQNYDSLRKYQGKVVAIKNKAIIAVSDNIETLLKNLELKNENPACLLLESIPPKNVLFIL
jgi:hypothetical protein